ncbi:LysR family transcriptional regulator [Martelella sp. HB161492]|uniref:LysR family transcriptional regulator n=1 Tax=Martelella sp. HB161492 TaxID=2720726 RepID=UPI00158F9E98|nr:LysR family transcriptional regulator [Martelella sp. HB161492]
MVDTQKPAFIGSNADDSDRLSLISAFVNVASLGSFSAAAESSKTNASTISRRVSRLEDLLGVRLFNRTTRRVSLTEPGRLYYDSCLLILEQIAEADAMMGEFTSAPRGKLRITMPVAFGRLHMVDAITEFMIRYPDVEVEANSTDRFVDLVAEGYDIAIRTGSLQDSGLVVRQIAANRRLLVGRRSYLERHFYPRQPEDLVHLNCLRFTNYSAAHWQFQNEREIRDILISGTMTSDSSDAIYGAILKGLGIGLVAEYMCHNEIASGEIEVLLPEWAVQPEAKIYISHIGSRHISPKVRAFSDFVVGYFRRRDFPRWN